MTLFYTLGNKTLYEGTASGKEYNNGNLQNVIYLGTYKSGEKDQIHVDLQLDKNVGLEYCDLLTKNDWKFMMTEIINLDKPGKPQTIRPPKTGDESQIGAYVAFMGCAIAIILGVMVKRRKYSEYK